MSPAATPWSSLDWLPDYIWVASGEFGAYKRVYCKLAKNQHVSETRSMALEEFAQTLDKDQTRAVHASKTEWYIEGPYWLVKILGKAYQTEEDQVIAGQEVPKGYWLVPAQWYNLVQTSQRAYVLLQETIQLNANSLVRLPEPIQFEPVKARKQPKAAAEPSRASSRLATQDKSAPAPPMPLPQREKPNFLGEPKHNVILCSLADMRL